MGSRSVSEIISELVDNIYDHTYFTEEKIVKVILMPKFILMHTKLIYVFTMMDFQFLEDSLNQELFMMMIVMQ